MRLLWRKYYILITESVAVARVATEVRTVKIKDPRGIATASRVVSKLVMFLAFARIPHNLLHVLPYLFERFPITAFTHTAKTPCIISNEIRNSYEITHLAKTNTLCLCEFLISMLKKKQPFSIVDDNK